MKNKAFRKGLCLALALLLCPAGICPAEETVHTPEPTADPLELKWEIYDGEARVLTYERPAKEQIRMPSGTEYTRIKIGVLTFRRDAFRRNAAAGIVKNADSLQLLWETETWNDGERNGMNSGTGLNSQPVIVRWSVQVRESSNFHEDKKGKTALKEVIIAGMDGKIRFLDLTDGTPTRDGIDLGYPMTSTPSLHPTGMPYMNVGQYAREMKDKTGKIGLRQYNLYDQREMALIDGLDEQLKRTLNEAGSFNTSALIDRNSDTVVTVGSNGMLYLISLQSEFDYSAGIYQSTPRTVTLVTREKGEENAMTAVESSPAMHDRYVYYADMGGYLRCVDTDTLSPRWITNTGDSVLAAVALDRYRSSDRLDLYTANVLNYRDTGDAQIRRYNADSGLEEWCTGIGVEKSLQNDEAAGCVASPVIGEFDLDRWVYFTVTGLSAGGCAQLNVPAGTEAALVALEKKTGAVVWAYALSGRSVSSPVAVYDENGDGWIIQCAKDGTIVMLDGRTGGETAVLKVDGEIEGSPAVYDNIMVIGTAGRIYGIRIGTE